MCSVKLTTGPEATLALGLGLMCYKAQEGESAASDTAVWGKKAEDAAAPTSEREVSASTKGALGNSMLCSFQKGREDEMASGKGLGQRGGERRLQQARIFGLRKGNDT